MIQIQVHNELSTNIRADYKSVVSIELDDKPFAEGNFGEVYHCLSINGKPLKIPQVIKIFKEERYGDADDSSKTISKLQIQLDQLNRDLQTSESISLFDKYPALQGVPQFSFKGQFKGKKIQGFSSDNLKTKGFEEFEEILATEDLMDDFYAIPLEQRIYLAYQLVSAFKVLDKFKYIHADLKEGAIFINMKSHQLAIIDFDSGVVTDVAGEKPQTWGAIGDWVAPEIFKQIDQVQSGAKINVDIFTDRWSVAVGVNYLISGVHPLFYLKNLGTIVTDQYFNNNNLWPEADAHERYFKNNCQKLYEQYKDFVDTGFPSEIKDKIAKTINFGYQNPVARTTYDQWEKALEVAQKPPKIKFLSLSKSEILEGEEIVLSWSTDNAQSVEIIGVGKFGTIDKVNLKPSKSINYQIIVKGFYGELIESRTVNVIVAPTIQFSLSKSKIKIGESTRLSWNIKNASSVNLIENNNLKVGKNHQGEIEVAPKTTAYYFLEIVALDNKTLYRETRALRVFAEGEIVFFKADRQFIYPTIDVELSWEVNNALEVEIEGIGKVPFSGSLKVQPKEDTVYILLVRDNFETLTERINIKMLPLPTISAVVIPAPELLQTTNLELKINDFAKTKSKSISVQQNLVTNNYRISLGKLNFTAAPKKVEVEYETEKMNFLARVKKAHKLFKKEMILEKSKIYVRKKEKPN